MSTNSQKKESKEPKKDNKNAFNNILKAYLDKVDKSKDRDLSKDNLEFEVRFGTRNINKIGKTDTDNVIRALLGYGFKLLEEEHYMLRIQNEVLEKSTGRTKIANIRTEISGLYNIQEYCKTDSIAGFINKAGIKFTRKAYIDEDLVNPVNQDDFNFRISLQLETDLLDDTEEVQSIVSRWKESKKVFRYIKRYTLVHAELPFNIDISIVKTSHKERNYYIPEFNIKSSRVFENDESYELEIEIDNKRLIELEMMDLAILTTALRTSIKYVLTGLQETNFPVSYPELAKTTIDYLMLSKGDKYRDHMKSAMSKDFIGPSSLTLQMQNIISLSIVQDNQSAIPNIRNNYTVTDKADGERKLLYINDTGRLYFITTNMKFRFTGCLTNNKELVNTIIDGEYILYNKKKELINLYAAFDIYFVNKKNITSLAFVPIIENADKPSINYRFPILSSAIRHLNIESSLGKDFQPAIRVATKKFYAESAGQSIFTGCAIILQNIKDRLFEYETDGLIFTPMNTGVASNRVGVNAPVYKTTWEGSFKWKPPEFNTIDFLITVNKDKNGLPLVKNVFESGLNMLKATQLSSYQTITLRVGFDEKRHGYINPFDNIVNDLLPKVEDQDNYDTYKPVQFYPTNPTDIDAGITNIMLEQDNLGNYKMKSENNEIVEDNTIVEFRYDMSRENMWKWVPLRVRYDKTSEFKSGQKNFGNAYHVANSNWQSINNPITEEIISTGLNIVNQVGDDDVYYIKTNAKTLTRGLRDFHNLFVKNILINNISKPGNILIDYAVGKGGDIPKWIAAKLLFVLGLDLSRDNIENKMDGACARYLNYMKQFKNIPRSIFLQANTSVNIRNGDALFSEKGKQIINAVEGQGPKDEIFLGKGIYNVYGAARDGFNISSIQFAIHYMFENKLTLNNFLRNVSENTKVGGFFIGTSYDGETIFKMLANIKIGESQSIFKQDKKIWELTKQYNNLEFMDNASSLGYAIDVFQESINKTIREYLVNYSYLSKILENYGFVPLTAQEYKTHNLPNSIGMFSQLYYQMQNELKSNPELANSLGSAYKMDENERKISFLNKYFVYKKVRDIDAEAVAKLQISNDVGEELDLADTLDAQKQLDEIENVKYNIEEKKESAKEDKKLQDEIVAAELQIAMADAEIVAKGEKTAKGDKTAKEEAKLAKQQAKLEKDLEKKTANRLKQLKELEKKEKLEEKKIEKQEKQLEKQEKQLEKEVVKELEKEEVKEVEKEEVKEKKARKTRKLKIVE